jgi:TatD DNase family protein
MYIDTHTHLFLEEFDSDLAQVIERAEKVGVRSFILPNVDSQKAQRLIELSKLYPQKIFPLMGLHPSSVTENYKEELQIVENYLESYPFFGIGEIGIDLYWDKTFVNEQIIAFQHQIGLARKYHLPIVIHVRNSFSEIFESLESELSEFGNLPKGVFHCFTGNLEQAQKAISLGFYLGIGGVVTFKNSGLDKVLENIPLSHLLLETDSPYLAPTPHRGKRNESAYIPLIANKLAQIYQTSINEIAKKTTQNANALFFNLKI